MTSRPSADTPDTRPAPLLLGVNVDHVATLRQARGTRYPDPVHAALVAEQAGADLITVHLREDRRHIQERDVQLLQQTVTTHVNLEMAVTEAMLTFAERLGPADCCLVPERREELTTEGGLDVLSEPRRIAGACEQLQGVGIRVSLFIDPDDASVEAAAAAGATAIELHTGRYADAVTRNARLEELLRVRAAAERAAALGLVVNAGHGLHYHNVAAVSRIAPIVELNIGHAVIARAALTGMDAAVRELKRLMDQARRDAH